MNNKNFHILVVDDDDRIRELVKQYLEENKFLVTTAINALDAKKKIEIIKFDMLILDIMMPGESGLSLTKEIKKNNTTPIMLLTAKGETQDRIKGLEFGADDYLAKPFEPEELYLRIIKLLELFKQNSEQNNIITFGNFLYNLTTFNLKKENEIIYLTEGENKLLNKLVFKRNEIVLREELAESDFDENELRKIDVQVNRLRQKIEKNPKQPHFIKTIRGKGYKLICN